MVPSKIKNIRNAVPILGILALAALFFKLPEVSKSFGLFACKTCMLSDPYLPLIGAGYFAALVAIALLFPTFPGRLMAKAGLTGAILLAAGMTYVGLPAVCIPCLIAHVCHIAMWTIWAFVPAEASVSLNVKERVFLAIFAPFSIVALFSCLNLTFMAYGVWKPQVLPSGLRPGDPAPTFASEAGQTFLVNFVSPGCPYCQQQLSVLSSFSEELKSKRCINISPKLMPELVQHLPSAEWIEDQEGKYRNLFKVYGYPTLFIIGSDGKISRVIPGAPQKLKEDLHVSLMPK